MAKSSAQNVVNLDALIPRTDFAAIDSAGESHFETVPGIPLRDLETNSLVRGFLRKPDFQRETNHWQPDQVVSLIECFVNGDLIPSIILWKSNQHLFVIDGGHRLSALIAWVEDDYGDRQTSRSYFGNEINAEQKKTAEKTRAAIASSIGSYAQVRDGVHLEDLEQRRRALTITTRHLPIQWVKGDADKAEQSFFKINTQGTPLDKVEERLLKQRKTSIAISARAVIRAGQGHKYWSQFSPDRKADIEKHAKELHDLLFEPEVQSSVRTLDLPLGGTKGVRKALQILMDFAELSTSDFPPGKAVEKKYIDDETGEDTVDCLRRELRIAKRLAGNDQGSLGLHPAVYFYGANGRHLEPFFMGTVELLARMLRNNNSEFFKAFTRVRKKLEGCLIEHKSLLSTIVQQGRSKDRSSTYYKLLSKLIEWFQKSESATEEDLLEMGNVRGKILSRITESHSVRFSDEVRSEAFLTTAISKALQCSICGGYLHPEKSLSFDHKIRVRDGGTGSLENCDLTHPYCNQSVKC